MRLGKIILIILIWNCSFRNTTFAQSFDQIRHYKVNYSLAIKDGNAHLSLRSFTNNNQHYLLLLNPKTLDTRVDLSGNYQTSNLAWTNVLAIFRNTPYIKSLETAAAKDIQLQDAGIDQAIPKEKGITLTVDLCPSHKSLDRIIFQSVFNAFNRVEQPAPIAVSVSGKWMMKHQDDLSWLKSLVEKKELNISWVNHSYNHDVNSLPLPENFLLAPGTNLDTEVLENEKLMLKNGLTPSVFFRFPGLVSDKSIVEKIESYGLIPIGSDAWLAKGQQANKGSIVLIHGNGNEEIGVKDFLQLLKAKQIDIKNKQWLLFDLKQGLQKEFQ